MGSLPNQIWFYICVDDQKKFLVQMKPHVLFPLKIERTQYYNYPILLVAIRKRYLKRRIENCIATICIVSEVDYKTTCITM